MNLKMLAKAGSKLVIDNLPTILSVVAVGGLIGSVITAIADTPKAHDKIVEVKLDKAEELERNNIIDLNDYRDKNGELCLDEIKLTVWEYIKILTPIYWKTGVCVGLTTACILGSNHISKKRIAALITAYSLKDKQFKELSEKVKEVLGEKKSEEIQDEIVKDQIMDISEDGAIETGNGKMLFYDPIMQTFFRSSTNSVKSGWTKFLNQLLVEEESDLTSLYYYWGIPLMDTYITDRIRWSYSPEKHVFPEIKFSYMPYEQTGEHCARIVYDKLPDLG